MADNVEQLAAVRVRLKQILRRDLKLGPDAQIADDMRLFDSDADLDSLDMLLLVASIEREFGFRIPNESIGQEIFQTVDTLARYVSRNKNSSPVASPATSSVDVLAKLPHGEPFRFVSSLVERKPGESAVGTWIVTGEEPFLKGHFPGRPVVPGVLIAEALAQLSGLVAAEKTTGGGALVHVDVRFESPVAPPAVITLRSRVATQVGALWQFDVLGQVDDKTVARGSLSLHLPAGAAT